MRSAAHPRGRPAFAAVELIVITAFILTGVLAVANIAVWLLSV